MTIRNGFAPAAEVLDFKVVGQEEGMLLVQVQMRINGVIYDFVGPLQVVKDDKLKREQAGLVVTLNN